MDNEIKAECTWGDGPDVTLSLEGKSIVLCEDPQSLDKWTHGVVTNGLVDLTADEALRLASRLTMAAHEAKRLDQVGKDHDEDVQRRLKEYTAQASSMHADGKRYNLP